MTIAYARIFPNSIRELIDRIVSSAPEESSSLHMIHVSLRTFIDNCLCHVDFPTGTPMEWVLPQPALGIEAGEFRFRAILLRIDGDLPATRDMTGGMHHKAHAFCNTCTLRGEHSEGSTCFPFRDANDTGIGDPKPAAILERVANKLEECEQALLNSPPEQHPPIRSKMEKLRKKYGVSFKSSLWYVCLYNSICRPESINPLSWVSLSPLVFSVPVLMLEMFVCFVSIVIIVQGIAFLVQG